MTKFAALPALLLLAACNSAQTDVPPAPDTVSDATTIGAGQKVALHLHAQAETRSDDTLATFTVTERIIGEGNTQAVTWSIHPASADLGDIALADGDRLLTSRLLIPAEVALDPTKHHTLALAKINPERPHAYQRYLEAVQPIVEKVGGRFVHLMLGPDLDTPEGGDAGAFPPERAIIVEWDTLEALPNLFRDPAYEAASPLLSTGVRGFEFYQLSMN